MQKDGRGRDRINMIESMQGGRQEGPRVGQLDQVFSDVFVVSE